MTWSHQNINFFFILSLSHCFLSSYLVECIIEKIRKEELVYESGT